MDDDIPPSIPSATTDLTTYTDDDIPPSIPPATMPTQANTSFLVMEDQYGTYTSRFAALE